MLNWPRHSVVGIDVSDRSVEALQLQRWLGHPALAAYSRMPLPAGVVEDGRILQPAALAKTLRELLIRARPAPIKERRCVVALPESQIYSHVFSLPAAFTPDLVHRAILLEAEHFMPMTLQESYVDYAPIGVNGETQEVAFTATRRGLVHAYIEVLKAAGLLPLAFEPESLSVLRSLVRSKFGGRATATLLLDVGARTTNVHLVRQGAVVGSLTIPRAGGHFTEAVAAALRLPLKAAETRKQQAGFDARHRDAATVAALAKAAVPIVGEVKRFAEYALEHRRLAVTRVILCGGSALLPGFAEFLSTHLGTAVAVGDPVARLWQGKVRLPQHRGVLYANVIGLALRGLHRNPVQAGSNLLLQAEDRIRRRQWQLFLTAPTLDRRLFGVLGALLAGLLVLAILVWYRFVPPAPTRRYVVEFPPTDWSRAALPQTAELLVTLAPPAERPADAVAARWLEGIFSSSDKFLATATSSTPGGNVMVRLFNTTSRPQAIVAQTRLQAADGTVLRLPAAAVVPADGTVTVSVPVPQEGGAIGGRLTLPGLPSGLQSLVYAEAVAQAVVVGAADLAAARERLQRDALRQATEAFVRQLEPEEYLLPLPIVLPREIFVPVVSEGAAVLEFAASLRQPVGGLAVAKAALAEAIIRAFGPLENPLQSASFTLGQMDLAQRRISVIMTDVGAPVEK